MINKADREGVYSTEKELEALLSLAMREDGWNPPIVKTVATEGVGIAKLVSAIESFVQAQKTSTLSGSRRQAVARWRIVELLRESLLNRVLESGSSASTLDRMAEEVATRKRDPYSAFEEIIQSSRN